MTDQLINLKDWQVSPCTSKVLKLSYQIMLPQFQEFVIVDIVSRIRYTAHLYPWALKSNRSPVLNWIGSWMKIKIEWPAKWKKIANKRVAKSPKRQQSILPNINLSTLEVERTHKSCDLKTIFESLISDHERNPSIKWVYLWNGLIPRQ